MLRKVNVRRMRFGDAQVFEGTVRLPIRPMRFCCYLVDGLLIDTGPVHARRQLVRLLSEVRPEAAVITHHHEDHTGNAAFFAKRWSIPVHLTDQTQRALENLEIPAYRRIVWGRIPERLTGSMELTDRLEWSGGMFRVIPTPGHCDDHVVLLEERRGWLFSGDLYVSHRMISGFRFESVPLMIRSLEKVLDLPFETVFCGHAGVIVDGKKMLKRKLEHLNRFSEEVRNLSAKGWTSAEITKELLPPQRLIRWFSGGEMSPVHLVESVLKECRSSEDGMPASSGTGFQGSG